MSEKFKSLLRHVLTVLGTIVGLIGLDSWIPIMTFIQANLDKVWDAVNVLVGVVLALLGFFKDKDRFTTR